jgi:O-antigen ligase
MATEQSPAAVPHRGADPAPTQDESNFATRLGLALYLLFIISWFLQSARRYPILGSIRFDLLLVIAISALCAMVPRRKFNPNRATWNATRFVVILIVFAVVTVPFVEWPGSVLKSGIPEFIKAAVFCLFTATLVRTERDLTRFMVVFVGCQMFRVIEPVYLHVTDGYWGSYATMGNWEYLDRLAGAPADIINPNGLAFVIVTALGFFYFLAPHFKFGTLAFLGFAPLALYALALTASRTGIIAFGIVIASIWWKSQRKVLIGAIVVTCVVVLVPLMSDDLADRYLSMFSSNTKNSATVTDRKASVLEGLRVATRRPFFGHGLGTSGEANANFGTSEQPTHNLYVEVAQELGFIGLPIFLAFMFTIATDLGRVRRRCRETGATGFVPAVADSMQVFLAMNLMVSLASYGLFGSEWYLMAGTCSALTRLVEELPHSTGLTAAATRQPVPARHAVRVTRPGALTPGRAVQRTGMRLRRDGLA